MSNIKRFTNGKIYTSNPDQLYAEAMKVEDGRITWIGKSDELPDGGETVDLNGKRVIPGIIDAHLHPLYAADSVKQLPCTLPVVASIEDIKKLIRAKREVIEKGEWIEGWGYDEGKLAEGRTPNRYDIDEVCSDVPVVLTRTCVHIISVNSKALELAGITKDTPEPAGGQIDRDENGVPTGVLRESARLLVLNKMPVKSVEENATRLAELSDTLLSKGITGMTEMMALAEPSDYYELYKQAKASGMKQRIAIAYTFDEYKKRGSYSAAEKDPRQQVHIGGVKMFADGSISGRTAWVNESFLGDDNSFGIATTTEEELLKAAEAAKAEGVQLIVHAMGGKAIDFVVDLFHGKANWLTGRPSVRVEHAAMPSGNALLKAAESGIAFVPQSIFLFAEIESYLKNLGYERTKTTYPIQTFLDAGILTALSSDAPATAWSDPVNPFISMQAAVTRIAYEGTDTGQSERINIETAISLYTKGAQEVTGIPGVGQLKEGYAADFVVLNEDILSVDCNRIGKVIVEETYMSGESVYRRETETSVVG